MGLSQASAMPYLPQQKAVKVVAADQLVQYVEFSPVGVAQDGVQSLDEYHTVAACVGRWRDERKLLVAEHLHYLLDITLLQKYHQQNKKP